MKSLLPTVGFATLLLWSASLARADDIRLLSAGAMQRGLIVVAQKFRERAGHQLKIDYATAPELRKILIEHAGAADAILAPDPTLAELSKAGRIVADSRIRIGGVGVAMLVRDGAPIPDIATMDSFKQALLAADAIVFNQASSGLYIETMLGRIGVIDQIRSRIVKVPDGEAVTARIRQGNGREVGFGGYTDVLLNQDQGGTRLVGQIPEQVQNYTLYSGAVIAASPNPANARTFLSYIGSPEATELFRASGVVTERR
jgi:molybdate transport system substrate-binding protein